MYKPFFNYCITPCIWLKSTIATIPKCATNDPHVNSITEVSVYCHIFVRDILVILNNKIVTYCEELDIFVDEQNCFRRDRSCTDHIFSFTSILRNTLVSNLPTFTCFIDMQKSFDWVDLMF